LIRVREFTMKDSYSLDADWEGLDRQYRAHYQAYFNIFRRCGLPVMAVKADVGMMGGKLAHEFMYLTGIGEDTLLLCDACGSSANRQVATFRKALPDEETPRAIQKVATPACKSIEELANYLNIPRSRTAKAVFLMATIPDGETKRERLIFTVIRGDMEVNETKLASAVKAQSLRPATEAEIRLVGAVPGYASPVGLKDTLVIVDDAIPSSPNLVAGANEEGFHLLNTNYGRDYRAEVVADIAAAQDGDLCPRCSQPLRGVRGVEVGNIFKLGTHFSESMGCNYLDADGQSHQVVMGSYGIGVGRLMACLAEEHHDEYGLVWPVSVAPYLVHLVLLAGKGNSETSEIAGQLYADLRSAGIDTLYDDRAESPGVKFNDADLIGLPVRITVSERALKAGGVELKRRDLGEREIVQLEQVISRLQELIADLQARIDQTVSPEILEEA
jgi:prolyl-tRNA synthetase